MNIIQTWRSDWGRPIVDPLPESNGVIFRLIRGDVCWPFLDPDGMFAPKKPWILFKFRSWIPLPFFAWKWGNWMGYIGFKVYGVDSEHYLQWLPAGDVYPGSQAMMPSFRPFAGRQ